MVQRFHYWIVAKDPDTLRPYLVYGSSNSVEECRQKGLELLGGVDFEIKRYPTRDLATASAYLRGKRLEQTHSLGESSRRIGHNKSLKRLRRRQAMNDW